MVICMSKKSKKKEEQAPETQEAENQAPEKSEVKPAPKPPREAEPLRIFFTVLLILVGAAELALWGYLGFAVYQSIQTQRTNHTQQGVSQTAGRAGYIGPGLMLENGVPVDLPPTEDTQPAEKSLASLSVPVLPYALAEDDMPDEPVEPAVAS